MSDISKWSPVDNNNTDPPPDGWPEGQSAPSYNDCARAMMGAIRRQWEDRGWFDWGHAVTYVSASQFQVPGDETAVYKVGMRVRVTGSLTGTLYGTITGVSVAADTTVSCAFDSGTIQNEGGLAAALGADPTGAPISGTIVTGGLITLTIPVAAGEEPTKAPGYLLCDGRDVLRADYPALSALYAAAGYPHGSGDGSTTFGLPDLSDRVVAGVGASFPFGTAVGAEAQAVPVPEHSHAYDRYAEGSQFTAASGSAQNVLTAGSFTTPQTQNAGTPGVTMSVIQPSIGFPVLVKT